MLTNEYEQIVKELEQKGKSDISPLPWLRFIFIRIGNLNLNLPLFILDIQRHTASTLTLS